MCSRWRTLVDEEIDGRKIKSYRRRKSEKKTKEEECPNRRTREKEKLRKCALHKLLRLNSDIRNTRRLGSVDDQSPSTLGNDASSLDAVHSFDVGDESAVLSRGLRSEGDHASSA